MATTPNLGLTLPTVGADLDTWGTELNTLLLGMDAVYNASTGTAISLKSPTFVTPALGTPASGTLTNCTGLPLASVTGLGTGVGTFLATPSSANLAAAVTDETGTGALVFGTGPTISSPTLVTPTLGVAAATSINKMAITAPATSSTLAVADGKTFTVSKTLTLTGTDSTTMTFPSTSATLARTDAGNTFTGHQTIEGVTTTGATGTGNLVFSNAPTFTGVAVAASIFINGGGQGTGVLGASAGNPGGAAIDGYFNGASGNVIRAQVDQTSANIANFFYQAGAVGSITTNGTATSYNTSSDARLKINIRDSDNSGPIVDGLRVRAWDWKFDGRHEAFGFIAQEEVLVAPFAVTAGDDSPDIINRQWGRDDSKLVPLLVKEIQSLRARVAILEEKP